MPGDAVTLFLCGDVMTGRGVDQILPHPGSPALWEEYVGDARRYVEMAERVNGPIPSPVPFEWPWGVALREIENAGPDVRVINAETSVTTSDDFAAGKGVHYRMHPRNVGCLSAGRPDVVVLANNHVLDFGRSGLEETLRTLSEAGLRWAGAGHKVAEAEQPAIVPVAGRRVVVCAYGMPSSGVPSSWAAGPNRPGVRFAADLRNATAQAIVDHVRAVRQPGDIAVVSLHWGSNWGYHVERDQIRFAHRLIDGGVDIVHGHSSHHARPIELYRDRLILYGCGDFIDDYEGIGGYERFRDDLRLLYLPSVDPDTGKLHELRMIPVQGRRMRLEYPSTEDIQWLRETITGISSPFDTRVDLDGKGRLVARTA